MYLVKTKTGYFIPFDDSDRELSKKIGAGEVVKAKASRNFLFHKKAFALLNLGFEQQDKYTNFEIYRKVMTIRAGFYDEVINAMGNVNYLPHSLSFDEMSAEKFSKWYDATIDIISKDISTSPETIKQELDRFY